MPAMTTKAGGVCIASGDVCLVPSTPSPLPIPFVNLGQCADAVATAANVLVGGAEAVVESSMIPFSTGDEAGSLGGIVSGTFMGLAKFKTGSAKVKAGGKRVVLQGATVGQNGSPANAPFGQQLDPSQGKVTISG